MLAQLADLAMREARAAVDPHCHADSLDRPQAKRRIVRQDAERYWELRAFAARLVHTARRHGFSGSVSKAWD